MNRQESAVIAIAVIIVVATGDGGLVAGFADLTRVRGAGGSGRRTMTGESESERQREQDRQQARPHGLPPSCGSSDRDARSRPRHGESIGALPVLCNQIGAERRLLVN